MCFSMFFDKSRFLKNKRLNAVLDRSWGDLGSLLGGLGVVLAALGALLGGLGSLLGRSWTVLGLSWGDL